MNALRNSVIELLLFTSLRNDLHDLDGSRFVMLVERRDSNYQNAKVLDQPPASAEANGNIMTY